MEHCASFDSHHYIAFLQDVNLINDIQAELEERVDNGQVNGVEHPNIFAEPDHPLLAAARNRNIII